MNDRSKGVRAVFVLVALALAVGASLAGLPKNGSESEPWYFAVSGDSRNYGDVVMPAIAASVLSHNAKFYWHLGDFRLGHEPGDQDIQNQPEYAGKTITAAQYLDLEWTDFLEHQIKLFGTLPVYLGIGNHDTIPPKTRDDFLAAFGGYLGRDGSQRTYYHWSVGGIDFINLDNASDEQFDDAQVRWFEDLLKQDTQGTARSDVKTIVVGMHRALPDSKSAGHSMNESPQMTTSGRRVYRDLVAARDEGHKNVYVLASHSHFYLEDVYNTACWKDHVLPGWIVGTAGAPHYPLPSGVEWGPRAITRSSGIGALVYGYLLGEVAPDSRITFTFQQVSFDDVWKTAEGRYSKDFVKAAFSDNFSERVDVHQARCPAEP